MKLSPYNPTSNLTASFKLGILTPASDFYLKFISKFITRRDASDRWDSNFIPRFTKIFEYWKNFSVIMFVIKNSAFPRNLSPWARSRAEKSHQTFRSLRLGEVPFKIIFLKNVWCHRNQR